MKFKCIRLFALTLLPLAANADIDPADARYFQDMQSLRRAQEAAQDREDFGIISQMVTSSMGDDYARKYGCAQANEMFGMMGTQVKSCQGRHAHAAAYNGSTRRRQVARTTKPAAARINSNISHPISPAEAKTDVLNAATFLPPPLSLLAFAATPLALNGYDNLRLAVNGFAADYKPIPIVAGSAPDFANYAPSAGHAAVKQKPATRRQRYDPDDNPDEVAWHRAHGY